MRETRSSFMSRRRSVIDDLHHDDPATAVVNLFDVAILIGVGFLVVALSGFGLKELLSKGDLTIVKDPGGPNMELIQKKGDKIERLRNTGQQAKIGGTAIGTVYRLENGNVIWVPKVEGH
jgi:hypothetical protein